MRRTLKMCLLKLGASFLLVGMMAATFAGQPELAFAQPPCPNPPIPIDASTGVGASCNMSIDAQLNPGSITLTTDPTITVTGNPFTLTGEPITAPISFTSLVSDHRGTTDGWQLQASLSAGGITDGTTHIDLNLTNVSVSCVNGSCVSNAPNVPLTLIGGLGGQTYLSAGDHGTTTVTGDYTIHTSGNFVFPATASPGHYHGTFTTTLLNTF